MVNRLKVPAESVENNPAWSALFPPEYWELLELVMADAPEDAVKFWRNVVIGKGKGQPKLISAKTADIAIRAAKLQWFGNHKPEDIDRLVSRGIVPRNETAIQMLRRQAWYLRCGWPVILVKPVGKPWTHDVLDFVAFSVPMGYNLRLYEYDDESVWPVPTPTSWRTSGVQQGRPDQDQDQEEGHPEGDQA